MNEIRDAADRNVIDDELEGQMPAALGRDVAPERLPFELHGVGGRRPHVGPRLGPNLPGCPSKAGIGLEILDKTERTVDAQDRRALTNGGGPGLRASSSSICVTAAFVAVVSPPPLPSKNR